MTVGYAHLRARLAQYLAARGLSKGESNLIVLAIDEACSNAVEHGGCEEVELDFGISGDRFRATVLDRGRPCDVPIPGDFDIVRHVLSGNRRGLGLLIIGKVMDVAARSVDSQGRNVLVLERRIRDPRR